jgi:DNA ligase 1
MTEQIWNGKVLLAKEYIDRNGKKAINPSGWWASEKWDGYRSIWTGEKFVSRTGKQFNVPSWFENIMPSGVVLDGEFYISRGQFENCGIFRKKEPDSREWVKAKVKFMVFDVPMVQDVFEQRMKYLKRIVEKCCEDSLLPRGMRSCPLIFTKQIQVKSAEHLDVLFKKIVEKGGEGVMIRKPCSKYEGKRSKTLLKYKQFHDEEARIVGYKPGTGKYTGLLGSFQCQLVNNSNIKFYVSGMVDEIRRNYEETHPLNTIITIIYNEKTKKGVPRHPRYLRKREEV